MSDLLVDLKGKGVIVTAAGGWRGVKEDGSLSICSELLPGESGWRPIPNHNFGVF